MKFAKEYRRAQEVIFSRVMQLGGNTTELIQLKRASQSIFKDSTVVLVDSDFSYGNVRALALALMKTLNPQDLLFIAYNTESLDWAHEHNIPSALVSLKEGSENAQIWNYLLKAKVAVYDGHPWWRTREQAVLNSLLSGAIKIQLWHGATGPVGKVFGLERLTDSKSFWHFVENSSTSVGFDYLVNEPKFAESRRLKSINANESLLDVEHRLVGHIDTWAKPASGTRILVAPTYPETVESESKLIAWIADLCQISASQGWVVDVNIHPGSKARVANAISKLKCNLGMQVVTSDDLKCYSAVVTDFSGIAHDSLMIGIPTVSVLVHLDEYMKRTNCVTDEDQMDAAYVVHEISQLEEALILAVESDPQSGKRKHYIDSISRQIGGNPGEKTIKKIQELLNS